MENSSRRKNIAKRFILGAESFLSLTISFALLLILVRIFEYFFLNHQLTLPSNSLSLEISGIGHDLVMLFNLAAYCFLPFVFLFLFSGFLANLILKAAISLFIIVEIALIQYFGSTSVVLGTDLFGYSFTEIMDIASAGGGFSFTTMLITLSGLALILAILQFSYLVKPSKPALISFCLLILISPAIQNEVSPEISAFKSELAFNVTTNKAFHLFSATYHSFYPEEKSESSLATYFYIGLKNESKHFEYLSPEYPFLRKDKTPDILGKFFIKGSVKPNIVIIIVESLGRAYSGEGAYLNSFTPFLDSLENRSLYWENTLSTAGRTFEVLPSVLGSLPYGKNGFAEMDSEMPEGMTLPNLLKKQGYTSRFFYGGDARFDNMKAFLNRQHLDLIVDEKDFGPSYKKMPANSGNFTWGYGEKDIFKRSFEKLDEAGTSPRLDIYLTLAMHDPYRVPDQEYYNQKAEDRIKSFSISESQKEEYRKYLPNYASILYFNDALRYFFHEYQKRPDFNNTIFLITGDHRMTSPPISTQIDRFHVPLVIYSSMLKSSSKFSSVVSHLDITPSIIAFLKYNYHLTFPQSVPWIGQGLDSATSFRNIRTLPFIRTKNEQIDFLDQEYFMVNELLFKISKDLSIDRITDEKKLAELQQKFEKFKRDNLDACLNKKIIPDSLIIK